MQVSSSVVKKEGRATAPSVAPTSLARLTLQNFRSYGDLSVELDSRPVVLSGPNGAGKTNLLEAVSMLAPGRGLRSADLKSLARSNGAGELLDVSSYLWAVSAELAQAEETTRIGTGAELTPQGGCRRVVRIDGAPAEGTSSLAHHIRMAWLTPAQDRLFMEGASVRRRFLDRLVLGHDPEHASRVASYEKAMRDRQRLLKERSSDAAWFSALEATMASSGVAIAAARVEMVAHLKRTLGHQTSPLFPMAEIALEGEVEKAVTERSATDVEDELITIFRNGRPRDAEAGRALNGPHRCDLLVHHSEKNMPAKLCSTGEQKALLIGLFLANARLLNERLVGISPILLLDEIAAHLDEDRRAALFDEICSLGCQAWMTGTDQGLFSALGDRAQSFNVDQGTLSPV